MGINLVISAIFWMLCIIILNKISFTYEYIILHMITLFTDLDFGIFKWCKTTHYKEIYRPKSLQQTFKSIGDLSQGETEQEQ